MFQAIGTALAKMAPVAKDAGQVIGAAREAKGLYGDLTQKSAGEQQLDYLNKAFPGTTSAERLGSSQSPLQHSAARAQVNAQRSMHLATLHNQKEVAQIQAQSARDVAMINADVQGKGIDQRRIQELYGSVGKMAMSGKYALDSAKPWYSRALDKVMPKKRYGPDEKVKYIKA